MDPDAVRDGERVRSTYGCIRWRGDRLRGRAVLGVKLGRLIVTTGDFATQLFPNYFRQDLDPANVMAKFEVRILGHAFLRQLWHAKIGQSLDTHTLPFHHNV